MIRWRRFVPAFVLDVLDIEAEYHMVETDLESGRVRPLSRDGKRWFTQIEQDAIASGQDLRTLYWCKKRKRLVEDLP